jgi:nicotinate-nucleotide pyrophosphorylase (carboxylating)
MNALTPSSTLAPLPPMVIAKAVETALLEDLGRAGDITTQAVITAQAQVQVTITARKPGVIAGLDLAVAAFHYLDPSVRIVRHVSDGAAVVPGTVVASIEGSARAILSAERTALNYLGHLSGIATATRALVDAVAGTKARICDTRKTTPGLRALEKYAVRAGGGVNHRFGLDDAVLIKDNHIAAVGGIARALERARTAIGHMVKIEIEVDDLDQLAQALAAGADVILLDNMSPEMLRRAVDMTQGRAVLEASGNVTLASVRAIAESGVDLISSGAITHSAACLDLGLDYVNGAQAVAI